MNRSAVAKVSLLLFGSGYCALTYQTVWLRQFRLIFGGSTPASAAVLAIFLGGLGVGGFFLGKWIDRVKRPLAAYAGLEAAIALLVAISPLLLKLVSFLYAASGGSVRLGIVIATLLRVLFALIVMAPATILMGGTLPAASRAIESANDPRRRYMALLYGTNTLGAVAGTLVSTFWMLEAFGNRFTLWFACLLNLFVAITALLVDKTLGEESSPDQREVIDALVENRRPVSPRFVYFAAAVVGCAFLLMELVWYRMLTPLLGGTTFTFGLILAGVLLGIGAGGCAYTLLSGERRPTLSGLAWTTVLEALALGIPFALGDRLAVLALLLRSMGQAGFIGHVIAWSLQIMIIVVPAAFISGIQFPLLVGLLGSGRDEVGRHVGYAYGWNTLGAIAGSLAAGFGLLPLLTAEGVWRLAIVLLALLALAAMLLSLRGERRFGIFAPVVAAAASVACVFATGPTAVWRHSGIGAGRAPFEDLTPIAIHNWENYRKRTTTISKEGIESSVAILSEDGHALLVNGKSDGSARSDAGTQVMSGLLGAMLHPGVKRSLVVGLGTGTTAGWLGRVETMETVDVVELERAVIDVVDYFKPVTNDVRHNKKVHIAVNDAREVLTVSHSAPYDLIVSEPSNPYRAGVASLFTREFYEAVSKRLAPGGIFLQWVQAYEIESPTLRTIYATYRSVFPHVYSFETQRGDLILVGMQSDLSIDIAKLTERMGEEPFRSALARTWRAGDVEAFLAHYVCGPLTAETLARGVRTNTDDRTVIEFSFARALGTSWFDLRELKNFARDLNDDRPNVFGIVDWSGVELRRAEMILTVNDAPIAYPKMTPEYENRVRIFTAYNEGNYGRVLESWRGQQRGPVDSTEILTLAEAFAQFGMDAAEPFAALLGKEQPIEAGIVMARLKLRQHKVSEAADYLSKAFVALRTDPWPLQVATNRGLDLVGEVARADRGAALELLEALSQPFAVSLAEEKRRVTYMQIARIIDGEECGAYTMRAIKAFEPHTIWGLDYLSLRARCYEKHHDPLQHKAHDAYDAFKRQAPAPLVGWGKAGA